MANGDKAGEPSMDEILASIRKIIAEDPVGGRKSGASAAPAHGAVQSARASNGKATLDDVLGLADGLGKTSGRQAQDAPIPVAPARTGLSDLGSVVPKRPGHDAAREDGSDRGYAGSVRVPDWLARPPSAFGPDLPPPEEPTLIVMRDAAAGDAGAERLSDRLGPIITTSVPTESAAKPGAPSAGADQSKTQTSPMSNRSAGPAGVSGAHAGNSAEPAKAPVAPEKPVAGDKAAVPSPARPSEAASPAGFANGSVGGPPAPTAPKPEAQAKPAPVEAASAAPTTAAKPAPVAAAVSQPKPAAAAPAPQAPAPSAVPAASAAPAINPVVPAPAQPAATPAPSAQPSSTPQPAVSVAKPAPASPATEPAKAPQAPAAPIAQQAQPVAAAAAPAPAVEAPKPPQSNGAHPQPGATVAAAQANAVVAQPQPAAKPVAVVETPVAVAKPAVLTERPKAAKPTGTDLAPMMAQAGAVRTLEDTVVDLLRPMLRQWLDDNMPRMVEKALRIELAESVKPKIDPPKH